MSDDDALLASVLRKVIADRGTWTGGGEGMVTIDGGAVVTPEEDAAVTRAYEETHTILRATPRKDPTP